MQRADIFFIEKQIGEEWFRYAGAFGDYDQARKYFHNLYPPLKLYRIARYVRIEIVDKMEEE